MMEKEKGNANWNGANTGFAKYNNIINITSKFLTIRWMSALLN